MTLPEEYVAVKRADAAAPVLERVAEERSSTELAVFGSVARGEARVDSDIGLQVQASRSTTTARLVALRTLDLES